LVAPLIGLSLGMLPGRATAVFIVIVLAISAGVMVFFEGWTSVSGWLLLALPITLFIIIYVVLYGRQAEAKAQAQKLLEELEDAHAELADYANQVEELTLAAERQRMARELHDTLAQGVAGLILQLEAVDAQLDNGDSQRAQAIVRQAMVRARGTLADARRAIDDLRKDQEDGRDLGNILQDKTDRFTISTNIPCYLDLDIPPTLSETLYEPMVRTVTEALANVAKHARATEVWVSLKVENQALAVEVRDNGVGFDPSAPIAAGHYGLQGMQERAELADGSVDIISQPGDGTTVRLLLPLDTALPISDP
jgi:NarL family two-component system sensor histidine kinase YdfH